jgi:FHS family L-fucose permease-like MFS transporter
MTDSTKPNYTKAFTVVTCLFFMWGFITVLVDSLIPRLKEVFELSYFEAGLVQFAFFMAYFFLSIPSGFILARIGYKKGMLLGLATMGIGCLMFWPAAQLRIFEIFLMGYFVLAGGMTILQVAANPYVAVLGDARTASSRLNLSQAFNSVGTTLAPIAGAMFILSDNIYSGDEIGLLSEAEKLAYYASEASAVQSPFIILALALLALAGLVAVVKLPDVLDTSKQSKTNSMFQSPFSFDGRIRRTEYALSYIIYMVAYGIINALAMSMSSPFIYLAIIPVAWFIIAQGAKRCHDRDNSGWYQIIPFYMFWMIFADSEVGVNEYGENPKYPGSYLKAMANKHLMMGALGIFVYVGAEVAIGSYLVNYFLDMNLAEDIKNSGFLSNISSSLLNTKDLSSIDSKGIVGAFVTFYWGGAMIGRFIGAYLTSVLSPGKVLGAFSLGAILLIAISMSTSGLAAMISILAVGLFNSIMFPTIFTIAIADLGDLKPQGSGILCTAIAGGAIIPPLYGYFTDLAGFKTAFLLLIVCYGYILFYGIGTRSKLKVDG